MAKAVPDGYHTLTPYLVVPNGETTLRFLQDVFGAHLRHRQNRPDGTIMHCELQVGDSRLMMAQAAPPYESHPQTFYVYLEDADVPFQRAVQAGAKILEPITTKFYGDRTGGFQDPAGNRWYVATHVEDVSPDEIQRRALAQQAKPTS
jgi:PhnB protein